MPAARWVRGARRASSSSTASRRRRGLRLDAGVRTRRRHPHLRPAGRARSSSSPGCSSCTPSSARHGPGLGHARWCGCAGPRSGRPPGGSSGCSTSWSPRSPCSLLAPAARRLSRWRCGSRAGPGCSSGRSGSGSTAGPSTLLKFRSLRPVDDAESQTDVEHRARRPARPGRAVPAQDLARRAAAAVEHPARRHEPGRARAPSGRTSSSQFAQHVPALHRPPPGARPGSPAGRRSTACAATPRSRTGRASTTTTSRTGRSGSTSRSCCARSPRWCGAPALSAGQGRRTGSFQKLPRRRRIRRGEAAGCRARSTSTTPRRRARSPSAVRCPALATAGRRPSPTTRRSRPASTARGWGTRAAVAAVDQRRAVPQRPAHALAGGQGDDVAQHAVVALGQGLGHEPLLVTPEHQVLGPLGQGQRDERAHRPRVHLPGDVLRQARGRCRVAERHRLRHVRGALPSTACTWTSRRP